jgi:hypothetical protein
MDLCIHSPILLHGVVLNYVNTGTALPFCYNVLVCSGYSLLASNEIKELNGYYYSIVLYVCIF